MSDPGLWRRIRDVAAEGGWAAVAGGALRRIRHIVYHGNRATWYEKRLDAEPGWEIPLGLEIRDDRLEELLDWLKAGDRDYMYVEEEIRCAREFDHVFLSVRFQGRLVGYIKIAFGCVYVLDFKKRMPLPDGMAFFFDMYVLPELRGRGIATSVLRQAMRTAKERGCRAVRCHIPDWNTPSRRAVTTLGFEPIGVGRYRRVLGIGWLRTEGFDLKR
jgi:GNAT superfamily N-acetyltransferase